MVDAVYSCYDVIDWLISSNSLLTQSGCQGAVAGHIKTDIISVIFNGFG